MALKHQTDFLKQAIRSNDLVYLSSVPLTDYNDLDIKDRIVFMKLLRTNIDTFGLNSHILEIAKILMNGDQSEEFRNAVDAFCKQLGRKTNDYGKMCYLKGKIEYLKTKIRKNENVECENIVDLDQMNKA